MNILNRMELIISQNTETSIIDIMKLLLAEEYYGMYSSSKFFYSYLKLHYIESSFSWNKNQQYRGASCTVTNIHHNYKIDLTGCYKAYPKYKKIYNILFI